MMIAHWWILHFSFKHKTMNMYSFFFLSLSTILGIMLIGRNNTLHLQFWHNIHEFRYLYFIYKKWCVFLQFFFVYYHVLLQIFNFEHGSYSWIKLVEMKIPSSQNKFRINMNIWKLKICYTQKIYKA